MNKKLLALIIIAIMCLASLCNITAKAVDESSLIVFIDFNSGRFNIYLCWWGN